MNQALSYMRTRDWFFLILFGLGLSLYSVAAVLLTPVGWVASGYHRMKRALR